MRPVIIFRGYALFLLLPANIINVFYKLLSAVVMRMYLFQASTNLLCLCLSGELWQGYGLYMTSSIFLVKLYGKRE